MVGCAVFVASNHSHPPEYWPLALALAFGTSIVWISLAATELLECLTILGHISGISPAVLGVTVLAWGNSIGDLVADVVIAKSGQPTMAVAACYSGPLFNICRFRFGVCFASYRAFARAVDTINAREHTDQFHVFICEFTVKFDVRSSKTV